MPMAVSKSTCEARRGPGGGGPDPRGAAARVDVAPDVLRGPEHAAEVGVVDAAGLAEAAGPAAGARVRAAVGEVAAAPAWAAKG